MGNETGQVTSSASAKLHALTLQEVGLMDVQKKNVTQAFSVWIRALMQNWRQGTVASKGRSDVNYSTKKPWKQKGTGRARAGSRRSGLWRGGGVIFGPQKRVRTLSVSRHSKKSVLRNIFINHLEQERVLVADWVISTDKPSTSKAKSFLRDVELQDEKIVLLLPWSDALTRASFNNIPNVNITFFDQINGYNATSGKHLIVLKKDLQLFKDMVSKWS